MALIRTNKNIDCPVCGSHKSCSYDLEHNRYLCKSSLGVQVDGFDFIRESGGFGVYRRIGVKGKKFEGTVTKANPRNDVKPSHMEATVQATMREIVVDIEKVFKHLSLNAKHRADLIKRGLTDAQIAELGFVSVDYGTKVPTCRGIAPGFDREGIWRMGSGMLCPMFNPKRFIIGYQIKNDNPMVGKYTWIKCYEDSEKKVVRNVSDVPYGGVRMKPLTTLKVKNDSGTWYLSEGALKPAIISAKFGVNVIGAVGGLFSASFPMLKGILERSGVKKVVWCADVATGTNPDVLRRVHETREFLKSSLDIELHILNYGQLLAKKGEDFDADEVSKVVFDTADHIAYPFFKANLDPGQQLEAAYSIMEDALESPDVFGDSTALIFNNIMRRYQGKLHSPEFNTSMTPGIQFEAKDRTDIIRAAYWHGYKAVLEVSPTGSGKSDSTGRMEPVDFLKGDAMPEKLWYAHKQHRDPSTESLSLNFAELPTKNTRLFAHPTKRQPGSNLPVLMREGEKGARAYAGNCSKADLQNELYSAGSRANLCKTCEFASNCAKELEPGKYGYLFESKEALKNDRIRANFSGINPDAIGESDILFVDEYSQSIPFTKTVEVGLSSWSLQLPRLLSLSAGASKIVNIIHNIITGATDVGKFGWSYGDLKQHYQNTPWASLIGFAGQLGEEQRKRNELNAEDGCTPELEWIEDLFLALSGLRNDYSLTISKGKVTIYKRNIEALDKLKLFKMVVYMDATATRKMLATQLGCSESEILVISQKAGDISNITINQIASIGTPNKSRTKKQKLGIQKIREWAIEKYGDGVGFIDWKTFAQPHDLVHFVDGRGSNAFKDKKAVVAFGIANTNLNAARATFEVISGTKVGDYLTTPDYLEFDEYYRMLQQAEILQEIGRLRAVRRSESLEFYSVSNVNLSFLVSMGYKYKIVRGYEIDDSIMTPKEAIIRAAIKIHEQGLWDKVSIRSLCNSEGLSRATVYRFLKSFKNGWIDFKKSVEEELINNPLIVYELIRRKVHNNKRKVIDVLTLINELRNIAKEHDYYGSVQETVTRVVYSPYDVDQDNYSF